MKQSGRLFFVLAALLSLGTARGQPERRWVAGAGRDGDEEKVPLDLFEIKSGYVFESDVNHGGSFGQQSAIQTELEYGHRFLIKDTWYVRAGLSYDRFDFGNSPSPLPEHLQRAAAVIGIEYMKGEDIGAILQFRPGFYFEDDINSDSFDCPITLARFFVWQPDKLFFLVGAHASFLRGNYPVIPLVGIVWVPNEKVRLLGILPEPRLIYSPKDQLEFWVGAELAGGAFRVNQRTGLVGNDRKLSGAQVDYDEYRAGVGVTYSPVDQIEVELGAGCAIQRAFNFNRAEEHYRAEPAPYVRVEIKGEF